MGFEELKPKRRLLLSSSLLYEVLNGKGRIYFLKHLKNNFIINNKHLS